MEILGFLGSKICLAWPWKPIWYSTIDIYGINLCINYFSMFNTDFGGNIWVFSMRRVSYISESHGFHIWGHFFTHVFFHFSTIGLNNPFRGHFKCLSPSQRFTLQQSCDCSVSRQISISRNFVVCNSVVVDNILTCFCLYQFSPLEL